MNTADSAEHYLRHQHARKSIFDLFQQARPSEAHLARVTTAANVALDTVAAAHKMSDDELTAGAQYGVYKDFAECAALYGFWAGYMLARAESKE